VAAATGARVYPAISTGRARRTPLVLAGAGLAAILPWQIWLAGHGVRSRFLGGQRWGTLGVSELLRGSDLVLRNMATYTQHTSAAPDTPPAALSIRRSRRSHDTTPESYEKGQPVTPLAAHRPVRHGQDRLPAASHPAVQHKAMDLVQELARISLLTSPCAKSRRRR